MNELLHAPQRFRDIGVDLAVGAFEIGIGHHARPAMSGPANIDHVEIACTDGPVEMDIDEIQAGRSSPMPEQSRLHVLGLQRLVQQGIVEKVDLADR